MSSSEEIWREIQRDDNRVAITGANKVRLYFSQLGRALGALERAIIQAGSTTSAEANAVRDAMGRLRGTFEALALKHFFPREGAELRIDSSDSGFAHWSALLELGADRKQREKELERLPGVRELKRRMLDEIVDHAVHPRALQRTILRRLYLESLAPWRSFEVFQPGPFVKVGASGDEESHFWSFATYDRSLNRPFLYLVYFAWGDGKSQLDPESAEASEIAQAAQHCASGRVSLLSFSNRLDEKLPQLRPRIVKRMLLGPFHAPAFTHPDGELGALLERLADRLPFALEWETETLISERETRVGAGWLSKGQLRQVFWIPKSVDLSTRGASQVERSVLLPHWLAQHVRSEGLLADRQHLAIDDQGQVHGLD